jgi:hypothetical protein
MSIGFKEWALVCEALGGGHQSIILRKGGIAEGRAGFRFQHEDFLLLPTLFHEQVSKLKLPEATLIPLTSAGIHTLSYHVHVEWTRDLTDWEQIKRLDPFHLWREQVIRERFEYDKKQGVSLAFVRVSKLNSPVSFPDEPKYGGCRSWVTLPDIPGMAEFKPVLVDEAHRSIEQALLCALES